MMIIIFVITNEDISILDISLTHIVSQMMFKENNQSIKTQRTTETKTTTTKTKTMTVMVTIIITTMMIDWSTYTYPEVNMTANEK